MERTDYCVKSSNFWRWFIRFLKFFAITGAVIVIVISAFLYFNAFLSAGTGPAGPKVSAEPFKQIWSQRPVLLLGIGDSITDGFGAPQGYSYFDRLIENPPDDSYDMTGKNLSGVFPKLTTKNIAVSGSVSTQHLKAIQDFPVQSSDILGVIVITTGGNDLIYNYGRNDPKECAMYGATLEMAKPWIQNYKERLEKMIVDITGRFPGGCHIFLANIYDPSDGTGITNEWLTGLPYWTDGLLILAEYNKIISQCSEKYNNVHSVDIYTSFLGHGIHCKKFWLKHYRFNEPHYWYYMNIEDPNPRGYDAIRRLFLLEIIKVFVNNK
jgi:lysophospholipase L1-like esterase